MEILALIGLFVLLDANEDNFTGPQWIIGLTLIALGVIGRIGRDMASAMRARAASKETSSTT